MQHKINFGEPHRVTGLAPIGFAVLIVTANLVTLPAGLPLTGADTAQVMDFFVRHGDLTAIATMLTPAAWLAATGFAAGAVAVLWPGASTARRAWVLLGAAGILLQNTAFALVIALRSSLTTANDLDRTTVEGVWTLHEAVFTLNGTFLAIALLGLTLAGGGDLGRWHRMAGFAAAALLFGSASATPWVTVHAGPWGLLGLTGWLIWVGWLVAYGIRLWRWTGAGRPGRRVP